MEKIHLIAHRGGYKESNTRQNSIKAIKYAVSKDYITGVEFDVRLTKDKKLVIIHDGNIKYKGKKYLVKNLTYNQLNDMYLDLYQEKIDSLEEVLAVIPKQKLIFLEIKNSSDSSNILQLVYNVIKKYPSKKIFIISFVYEYLKYFKDKGYKTCLLISKKERFANIKIYLKLYTQINMISLNKIMLKKINNKMILKHHKLLGIYTIDDATEINDLCQVMGDKLIENFQDKIYITTTNPKIIYERLKLVNEKN